MKNQSFSFIIVALRFSINYGRLYQL
jgi:hypothetical protein